ncbi:hypothetical protein TTHERM_00706380 (macronuclear) [Tetrahymena thermophila SB210]|uniref:Uncharacterized protein n=1 Tax=Tetrahymena thermophila (strain SB210) TaxID=312017 RepID=I7M780_TETTS|nr:hypothetical protein TTHERM_00706380 [Tetrahymena thermophila SB210]EAR90723.2 hypothetical protein TTHERM_00706380 [Tetrahymena thermophila SB210]|eukprot:XP_001010968.2 hypothetical protein TTHERM_00706380 [Tetrahymena thermophila SB210]
MRVYDIDQKQRKMDKQYLPTAETDLNYFVSYSARSIFFYNANYSLVEYVIKENSLEYYNSVTFDFSKQINSQEEVKDAIKVLQQIIEKLLAAQLEKFSLCLAGWESVFTDANLESLCNSVKKMKKLQHFCISYGYLQTIKITENAELDKRNRFIKSWFGHPNSVFTGKGLKYMNEMLKKVVSKRKDFKSFDLDLFRCSELNQKTIKYTGEILNTLATSKNMENLSVTLWYLQDVDIKLLKEPFLKFFKANQNLKELNFCFSIMKLTREGLLVLEEIIECLVESCQQLLLFRINLSASNATVDSYNTEEINILNRIFLRLGCLNTLQYFSATLGNWLNKQHLTADILVQSLIFLLENNPIHHLVLNIGSDLRGGDTECLKDAKDVFNMLSRCKQLQTLVILINGWKDCAQAHCKVAEMLAGLIEKNEITTFGLNLMNARDNDQVLDRNSQEIQSIAKMFKVLIKFPFKKFGLSLSDWNLSQDAVEYFEFSQNQLRTYRDMRQQLELSSKVLFKHLEGTFRKELIWDIQRVCFFGKINAPSNKTSFQKTKIIEI